MGDMEMMPTLNLLEPHNLIIIQVRETQDHHNLQMEEVVVAEVAEVAAVAVAAVELQVLDPHNHHLQEVVEVGLLLHPLQVQVLLQHLHQFKDHGKDH